MVYYPDNNYGRRSYRHPYCAGLAIHQLGAFGLFITGFLVGYVPILHYINGALAGDVGPVFLKNMTLWWGCPAGILARYGYKTGSIGMVAIGLCYSAAARQGASPAISKHERLAVRSALTASSPSW